MLQNSCEIEETYPIDAIQLAGNDADGDSDSPAAPVKTVDKTSTHTAKRNTDGAAPAKPAPSTGAAGGRRGGFTGSEAGMGNHCPPASPTN